MRTRTSFQKRQKEIARAEKQRDKAAKRQQKKLMGKQPPQTDEELAAELLNDSEGETEDETPAASSGVVD